MRPYSTRREYQLSRALQPSAMSVDACRAVIDFPVKLTGLRILDAGAGESDCVAWLSLQGAYAYAIDPRYRDLQQLKHDMDMTIDSKLRKVASRYGADHAQLLQSSIERTRANFRRDTKINIKHYAAALIGCLPFIDEVFDFIYSIDCIGKGIDEDESLFRQSVQDTLRVLRHGGELQIYPFLGHGSSTNAKNQRKVLSHIPHSVEEIGGSEFDHPFRVRIRKP